MRPNNGRGPPGRNLHQNRLQNTAIYIKPSLSFLNPEEYVRVLREATQMEFDIEQREIKRFSEKKFSCWPLFFTTCNSNFYHWIVVVRTEAAASCEVFPEPGEHCSIQLRLSRDSAQWVECFRIHNPVDNFALQVHDGMSSWGSFTTFQVAVPSHWGQLHPKPFDVLPLQRHGNHKRPVVSMTLETELSASLRPRISETTKSVEMKAIVSAFKEPWPRPASLYLLGFDDPMYRTNLFEHFPHMQHPDAEGSQLPMACKRWFENLHADQKQTYKTLLESLPCGIGCIHGASGTGKTHLALTIAAMAQAVPMALKTTMKPPQILFLMAQNRPLTDAINKMIEIYKQLGMSDMSYIRMYNFNYEAKYAGDGPKKATTSPGDKDNQKAGFTDFDFGDVFGQTRPVYAPQVRTGRRTDCLAPTLREACEKLYKDKYHHDNSDSFSLLGQRQLQDLWLDVVREQLASTHFIATTPVGASKMASFAEGVFAPAIVIIDDASQVREASTLVALTCFKPEAVLLVGDIHQPGPWVGNYEERNPYNPQLEISTMERHWAKAARTNLTVNHRALGNLHELCSDLWYGQMTSVFEASSRFPPATLHLKRYLQHLTGAAQLPVPRILIHLRGASTEISTNCSKYNPVHQQFVMNRVNELVHDPDFRSVDGKERGSILIITPYRAATNFYRKAVNDLLGRLDRGKHKTEDKRSGMHHGVAVDVRTVDGSQGSEADVVILDLVHETITEHIDNSKRLCVAMTRARQAQIVVMHRGMLNKAMWINEIYDHCKNRGQVFTIDQDVEAKTIDVKLQEESSYSPRGQQLRPTTRSSPPHSPGKDGCIVQARVHLPPSPQGE